MKLFIHSLPDEAAEAEWVRSLPESHGNGLVEAALRPRPEG